MKRITGLACVLLLVPVLAAAEPQTPAEWYKEGETQYNLGNFDEAVKAFKQGFALETVDSKKAAYLYNIAQSYRQAKNCTEAQFFYKRFLALRAADAAKPLSEKTRTDVERWIKELDECARQQEALRNSRPDGTIPPDGDVPDAPVADVTPAPATVASVDAGAADGGADGGADGIGARVEPEPRMLSARLAGGAALVTLGDDSVTRAAFALLAGYPIPLGDKLRLEVGAGFTYKAVPYESMQFGTDGTASLIGTVANAGLAVIVAPKLAVRGELGVGMLFLGGVSESQFTNGNETSGTLAMPHVRVGVSADYAITPNIVATVPLAFSYSPAKDGLREDISAITAFDFMVGLGYRM